LHPKFRIDGKQTVV